MKRLMILCLMAITLTGCSCTPNGSEVTPSASPSPTMTPSASPMNVKEAKDVVGEEGKFGTPVVSLKMSEGKITEVMIDEITDNGSKKELKDEYKMSDTAIAPWYKQVEALEKYIVENGVEKIETKDGKVVNEDLKSSVTITVEEYIKTINMAVNEAK